jgi:hypothetical protein
MDQIELDLPRAGLSYYENPTEEDLCRLRRILLALATTMPTIGYCQGMDAMALTILYHGYSEDETYRIMLPVVKRLRRLLTIPGDVARAQAEHLQAIINAKVPALAELLTEQFMSTETGMFWLLFHGLFIDFGLRNVSEPMAVEMLNLLFRSANPAEAMNDFVFSLIMQLEPKIRALPEFGLTPVIYNGFILELETLEIQKCPKTTYWYRCFFKN